MNKETMKELFEEVIGLKTLNGTEEFLNKLDCAAPGSKDENSHEFIWRPVGDTFSNAANINTATVSISPIIERITNGFDARIELEELEYKNTIKMKSPREAAEKLFKIPNGDTAQYSLDLSNDQRTKMAKDIITVTFTNSGNEKNPTIILTDKGTGIHPDNFSDSILKLGKSGKIHSTHLHGTFGHGGSSTFRYCPYSIIISRPNPKVTKSDKIGWTIVKQFPPCTIWDKEKKAEAFVKGHFYAYICKKDGTIPQIDPHLTNKAIEYGTRIAHIGYRAESWQNLSRGGGYMIFRNYLFDPIFPFRLEDERSSDLTFDRNLFGARSALLKSKSVVHKGENTRLLEDGGKMRIRYWVLFDKEEPANRPLQNYLDRSNSKNAIIVTQNGQRHGALDRSIIAKKMKMPTLSEFLLVQVIIDDLSAAMKDNLFTSGREHILEEGQSVELLKESVIDCLSEDEELREWEHNLLRQTLTTKEDESIQRVKKILNQLINVGLTSGIGGNEREQEVVGGPGILYEKYKPNDPPTKISLKIKQDPIELIFGKNKTITLEIDGPDRLLSRRKEKAELEIIIPEKTGIFCSFDKTVLKNGRLPISFFTNDSKAPMFEQTKIIFKLKGESIKKELKEERTFVIVSPPEFEPHDPPEKLSFLKKNPVILRRGKKNVLSIRLDGPNDVFSRTKDTAKLLIEPNNSNITLVGYSEPFNGLFRISFKVADETPLDLNGKLKCSIEMDHKIILTDEREFKIMDPSEKKDKKVGGKTKMILPNYKIERVSRLQWPNHSWNETNVGKHSLTTDEEGKDLLILYINIENENLEQEITRRLNEGHTSATINTLREKYVAYIAYHLYQKHLKEEVKENETEEDSQQIPEISTTQFQEELKRVSKTLCFSFMSLKDIPE